MIKEHPILFSAPMVRAILAGTKTQTRRIVKDATGSFWDHKAWKPQVVRGRVTHWVSMTTMTDGHVFGAGSPQPACPYGAPCERLWVRETHLIRGAGTVVDYRADMDPIDAAGHGALYGGWKPSIFMRRAHSRLTLEVVSVRVERLQEISEADAIAEGIPKIAPIPKHIVSVAGGLSIPVSVYADLWNSINGDGAWDDNPWVWVIEFKRIAP